MLLKEISADLGKVCAWSETSARKHRFVLQYSLALVTQASLANQDLQADCHSEGEAGSSGRRALGSFLKWCRSWRFCASAESREKYSRKLGGQAMVSQGRLSGDEWAAERREAVWWALPRSESELVARRSAVRSFVVFVIWNYQAPCGGP